MNHLLLIRIKTIMRLKFSSTMLLCTWLCVFLVLCGKKKQEEFVVIDSDTITVEQLSKISPDTVLTPQKIRKLSVMVSIAKQYPIPDDTTGFKETVNDLKDLLSQESGRNWSTDAAEKMYCVAKVIKDKLDTATETGTIKTYLDSLIAKIEIPSDSSSFSFSLDSAVLYPDTLLAGRKKQLATILSSLFCKDEHLSNSIAEFIYSESALVEDTVEVSDMVKGLVFDSAAAAKEKTPITKKAPVQRDNSALALKFRTQQSIQSTISEHIPYLKGIYKKELKKDPDICGTVYVTFRVSPSGEVIWATIKSSEIRNNEFINPFLDYVKKINFKPIPKTIGNMTFDFPFEFKPEL